MAGRNYGNPGGVSTELEVVRAIYDAFARDDVEAALRYVDDDADFVVPATASIVGRSGGYHGHDGVRQYFADARLAWDDLRLYADDFRAVGGGVVVFGRIEARSGATTLSR